MGLSSSISHLIFLVAVLVLSSLVIGLIWKNYFEIKMAIDYERRKNIVMNSFDFQIEQVLKVDNSTLEIFIRNVGSYPLSLNNLNSSTIYLIKSVGGYAKTPYYIVLNEIIHNNALDNSEVATYYVNISDIEENESYLVKICIPIQYGVKCKYYENNPVTI